MIHYTISQKLSDDIRRFVKQKNSTLFEVLLTTFKILIYRYTEQENITIAYYKTPVSQEFKPLVDEQIGLQEIRTQLQDTDSYLKLLIKVQHSIQQQNKFLSCDDANIKFVSLITSKHLDALKNTDNALNFLTLTSKTDLLLLYEEHENTPIELRLEFNNNRVGTELAENMLNHYITLLAANINKPNEQINQVPLLSKAEQNKILVDWNQTNREYPKNKSIQQLFESLVEKTPDAVALSLDDQQLTYRELNEKANQLANYLRENNVELETLVGVCLEHSFELIIGILAILKSGGAYVPLDPDYPNERLELILEDTNSPVLLTFSQFQSKFSNYSGKIISFDKIQEKLSSQSRINLPNYSSAKNLAYVIYTSGSTGKPKGVLVEHRSVIRLVKNTNYVDITCNDKLVQASSISFDAATFEIWGALLNGAKLHLISKTLLLSANDMEHFLANNNITLLWLTKSVFDFLILEKPSIFSTIKTLIIGGEALNPEIVEKYLKSEYAVSYLVNGYGPTENTTFSCCYPIENRKYKNIPIGKPIANSIAYILDKYGNPVPIGVAGELYVGGDGIARGYLNCPELTKERFIKNPFATKENKARGWTRLYKTGDLAQYLPDGNIEYLGRIDNQIKIRGFRIEPGEIENVLREQKNVIDVAVIMQEDESGTKQLAAYLIYNARKFSEKLVRKELYHALAKKLPQYMIPNAFIFLEKFPLTQNGKLDRKALAKLLMNNVSPTLFNSTIEQSNIYEQQLLAIWIQVLRNETITQYDNFFEVGGNSLLLAKIYSQLPKAWKKKLLLTDLFKFPTIHTLTQYLEDNSFTTHTRLRKELTARCHLPITEEVAIIGIACHYPGANNAEEFWNNLKNGKESISHYSFEELVSAGVDINLLQHPNYVRSRGELKKDIREFDADFFGYTYAEAKIIDPQQRLFLETAWEALEVAGYDSNQYEGQIGVYAGAGSNHYLSDYLSRDPISQAMDSFALRIANDKDFLSTRVAYKLNLTGPALTVQTGCSTSLVAVHVACKALLAGECDMALAGGVSLSLASLEKAGYLYQEGLIFSPDGHCRAFDSQAKGTVPAHGVGVVILKPLSKAQADRDFIYATIRSSALNNDGTLKVSFSAPSAQKQAEVIRVAHERANIPAESITYIEAHATGTFLGDPIEVAGLTEAFHSLVNKQQFCTIGSVKTNIGHTDIASGVAGLIKTALALKYKQIPPTLHFKKPNPELHLETSPFCVNTSLIEWNPAKDFPRRAGVSAFGVGGTNVHVVLEEEPNQRVNTTSRSTQLLTFSAKTASALDAKVQQLIAYLQQNEVNFADVAYTLHLGRKSFNYRCAVTAHDSKEAIERLSTKSSRLENIVSLQKSSQPIVFLFSGQGSHYPAMGQQLYAEEKDFRAIIDDGLNILKKDFPALYQQVKDFNYLTSEANLKNPTMVQPALFLIEYALAQLFIGWGVTPHAVIGHSLGEYATACVSGRLHFEDALKLVVIRSQLCERLPAGKMLAIPLSCELIKPYLSNFPELDLAVINHPEQCIIAGPELVIEKLRQILEADQINSRYLKTSNAFHSAMVEPILHEFAKAAENIPQHSPKIPYISCVTGTWLTKENSESAASYWSDHLRHTVNFSQGLSTLFKDPRLVEAIVLELGPSNLFANLAQRHPDRNDKQVVLATMHQPQNGLSDLAYLLTTLGELWTRGVAINWNTFYCHQQRYRIPLPTYPFENKLHWVGSHLELDIPNNLSKSFESATVKSKKLQQSSKTSSASSIDLITQNVHQIWQTTFQLPNLDIHTEYSQLNCDSLMAAGLLAHLSKNFGVTLTPNHLWEFPTIEKMARLIKEKLSQSGEKTCIEKTSDYSALIKIQAGVSPNIPIFLIHPVGGDIYFYHDLIKSLGTDIPIYAFRAPSLNGKIAPFTNVAEMANLYCSELQRAQANPPYFLCGASFGGLIAYEMSQQLNKKGHKVALLTLIDTPTPESSIKKLTNNADILAFLFGDKLDISVSKLKDMTTEDQLKYIWKRVEGIEQDYSIAAEFGNILINTFLAHQKAFLNYQPRPYSQPLLFFSPSELLKDPPFNDSYLTSWLSLAKEGGISIYTVPGNHFSMNSAPNVDILAQHLLQHYRMVMKN
jgi:amino acid adenylation domain-containing protein